MSRLASDVFMYYLLLVSCTYVAGQVCVLY